MTIRARRLRRGARGRRRGGERLLRRGELRLRELDRAGLGLRGLRDRGRGGRGGGGLRLRSRRGRLGRVATEQLLELGEFRHQLLIVAGLRHELLSFCLRLAMKLAPPRRKSRGRSPDQNLKLWRQFAQTQGRNSSQR